MTLLIPLHGIGTRHDLPLPFSFVVAGAALALVISFVVLFFAWRRPRYPKPGGWPLYGLTRLLDWPPLRWLAQLVILGVYGWAALALFAGKDLLTNPIFGFVFAWMWVGLVPLSLLLGPFWAVTNPLRTVHRWMSAVARTDPRLGLVNLPDRVGVWPAAVTLFGFGWLELVASSMRPVARLVSPLVRSLTPSARRLLVSVASSILPWRHPVSLTALPFSWSAAPRTRPSHRPLARSGRGYCPTGQRGTVAACGTCLLTHPRTVRVTLDRVVYVVNGRDPG